MTLPLLRVAGFAGAAAFFGGLTRLTFSLAVVMIEITDETHFLLPIMTAGEPALRLTARLFVSAD